MLNKRFALTLILFSALAAFHANAQSKFCYTAASLNGNWTVIGTYGAHVAVALGKRYFDGNGNMTGTFIVNEPKAGSATGERTIVTGTQRGTYTVNCDGTGVITRILTLADGTTTSQADDFIITGAVLKYSYDSVAIATAMVDAQRTPSTIVAGGIFLTRTYTRLPDGPGSSRP